jgi:hypothetical protein
MESQQRLHMITTLNEEADQKRLALTHALGAQERRTFHRIPTKMPFQAVFMRGGRRPCLHGRFSGRPIGLR